jgi:hypothetical protein
MPLYKNQRYNTIANQSGHVSGSGKEVEHMLTLISAQGKAVTGFSVVTMIITID